MSLYRLMIGSRKVPSLLQPAYKFQQNPNDFLQFKNVSRSPQARYSFQSNRPPRNLLEEQLSASKKQKMSSGLLVKPILFTVGVSTASFVGATIWEYENFRIKINRTLKSSMTLFQQRRKDFTSDLRAAWNRLSVGDQFFIPICALNVLVFALWRVPRLQTFMLRNFCSNPIAQTSCRTMLLSTFSHYSLFHIFANMYVLHSFCNSVCLSLGKEQTLAFYLTAGCVASLVSYAHKVITGVAAGSLGASGAILGILAYVCTKYPDTQLQIMFLPMFPFSADNAIKVIIGVDIVGCILGWKYFDHAAHLGGALFGIFWCYVVQQHIWPQRKYITQKWHDIRSSS